MKSLIAILLALAFILPATAAPAAEDLAPGDPAPAFTFVDAEGAEYTLDQFKGKRGVVLVWFPRAFTSGCTVEIKSLRDSKSELDQYNVAHYMVSLDTAARNAEFAQVNECDFPVLSDPTGQTAEAYGVGKPGAAFAKRWTYYIGEDGLIKHVDREVNVDTHGPDIVSKLGELGFSKAELPAE